MGNEPNKPKKFSHFFFSELKTTYFTGETIHGVVNLDLSSHALNLKEITIFLVCEEKWKKKGKNTSIIEKKNYEVLSSKIDIQKIFNDFNPSILLSGNKYTFPFSIFISPKILPTFDGRFYSGRINYSLEALYDSLEGKLRISSPIVLKSSYCLNDYPLSASNFDNKLNSLSKRPSTIFKVIYPYTNYSPGEPIPLIVEIDNTNSKFLVERIETSLVMKQNFFSSEGKLRFKMGSVLFKTCSNFEVKRGEMKNAKIVPVIPRDCWIGIEPTADGKIIKCFYELIIKVVTFESFKITIPISMTERTLRESKANVIQGSEIGNFEVIDCDFKPNTEYSLDTYEKYDNHCKEVISN